MSQGALLLKHGRQGKPKIHFFRLTNCDTLLKWKSSSGSLRQVKLRTVNEVVAGQSTEVFKRFVLRETALSFSLKYTDDDGSHRTLDLTCQNQQQFDAWHTGLRVVADRLRVTGAPAVPAAAAFAAQLSSGSFTSVRSAAEAARCYGGGTAVVSLNTDCKPPKSSLCAGSQALESLRMRCKPKVCRPCFLSLRRKFVLHHSQVVHAISGRVVASVQGSKTSLHDFESCCWQWAMLSLTANT